MNDGDDDWELTSEEALTNLQRARLRQAISQRLSPREEKVMGLHLEGMKNTEIAQLLGITAVEVGVLLFRARWKMKKLLREMDVQG